MRRRARRRCSGAAPPPPAKTASGSSKWTASATSLPPSGKIPPPGTGLDLGDIDGDGLADLAIGSPGNGGEVSLVLSPPTSGSLESVRDAALDGTDDDGESEAGAGVALGELDGDGELDLVAGAPLLSTKEGSGGVYVVPGPLGASLSLHGEVLALVGASGDGPNVGEHLVFAGDVDGGGGQDLLLSGYASGDNDRGRVWLVLGEEL